MSTCFRNFAMARSFAGHASPFWTIVLVLSFAAAQAADPPSGKPIADSRPPAEFAAQQQPAPTNLPVSRTFQLGFTPHDMMETLETSEGVIDTLARHADLIALHIGRGIPWEEALNNQDFPTSLQNRLSKIARVKDRLPATTSVYLAITPLAVTRNDIARYWGDSAEIAAKWKDRKFDDSETILAYTRYCRRMIALFKPDYFAYGVEVNMLAGANPKKFEQFSTLAKQVYETLKQEHPKLPIFLTFQIDFYHKIPAVQGKVIADLLPWSDYIAVSSYPYMEGYYPSTLPANWFSDVAALDPAKPFAIAETGFIAAESFQKPNVKPVEGSEQAQADYVRLILETANRQNGRFVVWFFPQDVDRFWASLSDPASKAFVGMWKTAGLVDKEGRARQGLKEWDLWFQRPVKTVR